MSQRPLRHTGTVSHPPRHGGSWPTTATGGVPGAAAGAPRPLSCSSSSGLSPHLLAPCGSGSALFRVPRRGHLQAPLPPRDWPASPSCPPRTPQHPPRPAAAQPCSPQPAPSWSPLTPGPCQPRQPVAPSPPTAPVLTQPSRGLSPCCLASHLGLGPTLLPRSGPSLGGCSSLTLSLRAATSASAAGIQGFWAGAAHGISITGWPGAWAQCSPCADTLALLSVSLALPHLAPWAMQDIGQGC